MPRHACTAGYDGGGEREGWSKGKAGGENLIACVWEVCI